MVKIEVQPASVQKVSSNAAFQLNHSLVAKPIFPFPGISFFGGGTFNGPPYRWGSMTFDHGVQFVRMIAHFFVPRNLIPRRALTYNSRPLATATSGFVSVRNGGGIWPFGPNPLSECLLFAGQAVFVGPRLVSNDEIRDTGFLSATGANVRGGRLLPSFFFPSSPIQLDGTQDLHIFLQIAFLMHFFGPGSITFTSITIRIEAWELVAHEPAVQVLPPFATATMVPPVSPG